MLWRNKPTVTVTHKPTGVSAKVETLAFGRRQPQATRDATAAAKRLLASKLAHVPDAPRPIRSYHLHTYLGVTPFIRQGDETLAVGMQEINSFLGGNIPNHLEKRSGSQP